jgi:prenyl protein peptidase
MLLLTSLSPTFHRISCGVTAILLPLSYVISLYLIPTRIRSLPRDDPLHILWRIGAVAAVTLLSPLAVFFLAPLDGPPLFDLLGMAPHCISPLLGLGPVVLVAVLFAGPIATAIASLIAQPPPAVVRSIFDYRPSVTTFRALVVAPVSEEVVFRAAALPLIIAAGATHSGALFASAVLFAVAHAHHYLDHKAQGLSHNAAVRIVAVQLTFTGAFALLTAHAFLRSGSLPGIIVAHALANAMGPPDVNFWASVRHPAHWARGTIAVAYITGIFGFIWLLITDNWLGLSHQRSKSECALSPSSPNPLHSTF